MAETTAINLTAMAHAEERDAVARDARGILHEALTSWRARRLIVSHEIRRRVPQDFSALTELILVLPTGARLYHSIRDHEIAMDGLTALRFWLDTIERELRGRRDRAREQMYAPPPYRGRDAHFFGFDEVSTITREQRNRMADAVALQAYIHGTAWLGHGVADMRRRFTKEADTKAKALFIAAAGEAAYQILESGQPLKIRGSAGTDYLLFKRASFCVERPSDGARLCAVVPDVPMYDHLLGIKLMVEHDEPAFLATANVSVGGYVPEEPHVQRERLRHLPFSSAMNHTYW